MPLSLSLAAWLDSLLLLAISHASFVTACMAGPIMTCLVDASDTCQLKQKMSL